MLTVGTHSGRTVKEGPIYECPKCKFNTASPFSFTRLSGKWEALSSDRIRIVRHEPVPKTGSYEVRFPDGRESVYFYWDDIAGRPSSVGAPGDASQIMAGAKALPAWGEIGGGHGRDSAGHPDIP
jgi:hypothetical protein